MVRKPRISGKVKRRLGRLLEMEYKVSELCEELGVHRSTFYQGWLRAGLPHRRDDRGRIWIVGTDLAEWARGQSGVSRVSLGEDEAFCLSCKKAVPIQDPRDPVVSKASLMIKGTCPYCGHIVSRLKGVDT